MQTLNFTPKLLRQRRFLSFLLPLFALFVGLGFAQSVSAQSTFGSRSVIVDAGSGSTTYSAVTNTPTGTPAPAGEFDERNFGSFDINTGQLLLNGGTFTINENGGDSFTQGFIDYRVFPGTLSPATATPAAITGSIQLVDNGVVGSAHTFSLSSASLNVIALASAAGTYRFDVDFRAVGNNVDGDPISVSAGNRRSQFTVTGTRPNPTSVGNSNVFINFNNNATPTTGNVTYGASSGQTPLFQGANLGTFDVNTGKLYINGGSVSTFESAGDQVQSARLIYQIIKPIQSGTPSTIVFQPSNIALTQVGTGTATGGGVARTFSNTTALRNLVANLANSGSGTYNVSVRYEADVLRNGSIVTITDNNGGPGYTANFTLVGIPILIDTWTGAINDDWFNPGNWDLNIIPNQNVNVVIPDFGVGNTKPYPNINAGVSYTASNNVLVNNTNSGDAVCRDIDMQGSTQAQRSILRLVNGRWRIYGSFSNTFDSYIQRGGTVCEFASSGNQTISGGTFVSVQFSGGGTKALTGVLTVTVSMNFAPNAGLLTTDISKPDVNYVVLGNRSVDAPDGAQLTGETDASTIPSYIRGFVRTSRTSVQANEVDANGNPDPRTFGNIGMTILFTGVNNPGDVDITRNTAESYTPLVGPNGGTARYGIRRIFGVRPSSPNTNNGGLVATVTFHYLDSELTNLGPQGAGSVAEPNLALFVSTSGGNQFGGLGRDALDQTNNILTKTGVRTFATFTLGDRDNPLPVTLTGFDAKRIGADALVTWQTASEQNNKGFNVQVSTDGKTYRTIGFVASETTNSMAPKAYTFTDTEKNKAGARYYRLEQLDVDGKSTFFAPRVVTFDGKAAEAGSGIVAYPNPLNNEILHLSLNSAMSGTGVVRILDMTGRQVAQRNLAITIGSNDVPVENMSELKSGLYILNVILPSGEKKTMKVTKQ